MILLDTNICAAAIRDDRRIAARMIQHGGRIHIPFMVAAELRFGVEKLARAGRPVDALRGRVSRFLAMAGGIAPLTNAVLERYAVLRAELEAAGASIGATDLWIAAQALAEDAALVTDNTAEFRRVPGLRLENWLRS
jgi:tRNA(fMet)-specific endonuclease VapC